MPLSFIQKNFSNVILVSLFRRFLYLHCYLGVFREYLTQQELLLKLHGNNVLDCHVNEFALFVEADVVVADV